MTMLDDRKWCHPQAKRDVEERLNQIFPRLDQEKKDWLLLHIREEVVKKIVSCTAYSGLMVDKSELDFWFLLFTGDCPICLRSEVHGTITDLMFPCLYAIMFRPCGHAICSTCFKNWREIDAQKLNASPECRLRLDEKKHVEIKCPVCRQQIQTAFRVDKVAQDTEFFVTCIQPLAQKLSTDLYNLS
jgi:hypothetical protein